MLKRGQSDGMQTRPRKGTERNRTRGRESGGEGSIKFEIFLRRNAVTAEGEDVKTNWIFASVTSFFADNSDLFSFCGRSLKPERRHSRRRLHNRFGSIAVLSSNGRP